MWTKDSHVEGETKAQRYVAVPGSTSRDNRTILQYEVTEQFAFKQVPLGQDEISVKPLDLKTFRTDYDIQTGSKSKEHGKYNVTDGSFSEHWSHDFQ